MSMSIRHTLLAMAALFFALLAGGCTPFLFSSPSEPTIHYRLDYNDRIVQCDYSLDKTLRFLDFTSSEEFNRLEMVYWGENHTVRLSQSRKWVTTPGVLLAENLRKDLADSNLFQDILNGVDPDLAELELAGRIEAFALEEVESGYRAVIRVKTRLSEARAEKGPLFQETYSLMGESFPERDPKVFVREMSKLAGEISRRMQSDLCRWAKDR